MRRVVSATAMILFALGSATLYRAQSPASSTTPAPADQKAPTDPIVYVCPMDPDVRSSVPGTCPRCAMKLADHVPETGSSSGTPTDGPGSSAGLLAKKSCQPDGFTGDRSAAAYCRGQHTVAFPRGTRRGPGEVYRRVGPHAGGER